VRRCGTCDEPIGPGTARCPRCNRLLPYLGSRGSKRPGKGRRQRFTRGKDCPVCGKRTERMRVPRGLRFLRVLLGGRFTYRDCRWCGWRGSAFHAPPDEASANPADRPHERVRKRRSRSRDVPPSGPGTPTQPPAGE
jgi:hypothetical protein